MHGHRTEIVPSLEHVLALQIACYFLCTPFVLLEIHIRVADHIQRACHTCVLPLCTSVGGRMSHVIYMWQVHPLHMRMRFIMHIQIIVQMYSWHPTSLCINICNISTHTHTRIYIFFCMWCDVICIVVHSRDHNHVIPLIQTTVLCFHCHISCTIHDTAILK